LERYGLFCWGGVSSAWQGDRMNRATKIIVSTIGVILAIAGLAHGIPEILQGNRPTEGLIIQAIGPDHQMWQYGTEEAFYAAAHISLDRPGCQLQSAWC
jgi:hypothetical protein